jgi:hypothetical protein
MDKEWKEMKEGHRVSNQGDLIIDHMADQIYLYKGNGHSEALVVPDILQEVKTLYNARQQRIHLSFSALSPQIWLVIIIGTILTLAINYLFGMNFYLHIVSVSAAALMAASIIYLLITLDRPFQGDFIVEPDAFKELQKYINTNPIAQRKTILNM